MFAGKTMLGSRLLRDPTIGLRAPDGTLTAAAGIGLKNQTATTSDGSSDDAAPRDGERLLQWAIDEAGDATLLVETESCSSAADALHWNRSSDALAWRRKRPR